MENQNFTQNGIGEFVAGFSNSLVEQGLTIVNTKTYNATIAMLGITSTLILGYSVVKIGIAIATKLIKRKFKKQQNSLNQKEN